MDEAAFNRRLLALGKVISNFSAIEMWALQLLSGFVEDSRVGNALVANPTFRDTVAKLKVLSTIPELNEAGKLLSDWASLADKIAESRNNLVHNAWLYNDSHEPGFGHRLQLSVRGKGTNVHGVVRFTAESIDDLEAIVERSYEVCNRIAPLIASLEQTEAWWNPDL